MMARRFTIAFFAPVALFALAHAAREAAAEARPSWTCLPDGTALMVRVPDAGAFVEAIRSRTKFGAVMMQPDRWRKIGELVVEEIGKQADADITEAFAKGLGRYGFSVGDLTTAFSGDFGAGIVVNEGKEGVPSVGMLLGWIDGRDAEAAERLFEGVGRMIEEAVEARSDDEFPVKRTDVEMAGRPVMWVQLPMVAEEKRIGTMHVYFSRLDGRLLVGATAVGDRGRLQMKINAGPDGLRFDTDVSESDTTPEQAERDATAATEEARGVFQRFLAKHAEPGDDSPLADLLNAPAMQAAMPAGLPLVEFIADPKALGDAARILLDRLTAFGLDAIGPIAWRQTLDGSVWRSHAFVSLPAPRHGLMRLLDEHADASEVPPFVTREAIGFQQISLDLGKAYTMLREAMFDGDEPPPGNAFGTAEMSAQSMLGIELPALLSSFGTRHWFIGYPPRIAEAIEHARKVRTGNAGVGDTPPTPSPSAIVWQVKDEAPFAKLLQLAAQAVGQEVVDEQGFRSVRFPGGAAVFLGKGHLVVAVGEGVSEKTLSSLRNTPPDDAAFRTSDAVRRSAELLPPEPGGLFGVSNDSRTGGLSGMVVTGIACTQPEDVPEGSREFLGKLQALLPSPDEMEGILGAGTILWQAVDQGIVMRTVRDMPAP